MKLKLSNKYYIRKSFSVLTNLYLSGIIMILAMNAEFHPFVPMLTLPYRKNSKNWDTLNYYRNCPSNGIVGFYSAILRS